MKNYKITEEQIKQLAKGNAKVKKMFPEVFENKLEVGKLEVGKWYKNEDYGNLVFMTDKFKEQDFESKFTTFAKRYGFKFTDKKEWYNDLYFSDSRKFTLATDTEVLEALTDEAKKRGFVKGAYFKSLDGYEINHSIGELDFWLEENNLRITTPKEEWKYYGGKGCSNPAIFKDGIWATLIKTYTKEEAEKLLNAKII